MVETKDAPKANNPYARLAPTKCFKCNQFSHHFNDCPLKKVVHLAEREEEKENVVCCEPHGDGKDEDCNDDDDDVGQN